MIISNSEETGFPKMKKILIDTSVLIDYLKNRDNPETRFLVAHFHDEQCRMLITELSILEIVCGLKTENAVKDSIEGLAEFTIVSLSGKEFMVKAGNNYRALRRQGITVRSMIDCLIATCALENNFSLLHRDRDFKPFEKHLGLKNPLG